jgi:hypothetical protein
MACQNSWQLKRRIKLPLEKEQKRPKQTVLPVFAMVNDICGAIQQLHKEHLEGRALAGALKRGRQDELEDGARTHCPVIHRK